MPSPSIIQTKPLLRNTWSSVLSPDLDKPVSVHPCLLWPSVSPEHGKEMDETGFPEIHMIKKRYEENDDTEGKERMGCEAFWEAALMAETILVLDLQFDEPAMRVWRDWLISCPYLTNLVMIIGKKDDSKMIRKQFTNLESRIKQSKMNRLGEILLIQKLVPKKYPFLHDRFAVTDGELWHFGGTVGGVHNGLTAVSRGWRANECRALHFFENLLHHFEIFPSD
ncbi:MAG: hypothetical protein HW380_3747 [Magnetococcales bacterium]|nr:hypothetical protein [Magnetococcales bacterium]